jgi:hypothetical protein
MKILITEEQFKTLSGYLTEQSSPDEIYQKYYSKIDKNIFDKIIEADPKTIEGIKIGKYAKLLLNIYKNGNLPMEDLPKASYYLSLVYKYNRSIPNNVKYLVDIYKIIEDKIIRIDSPIKDVLKQLIDGVDYIKVFETNNWWLFTPKTEKGAAYLGVNTEWCTTYGEHCRNPAYKNRDENAFNKYNNQGPLYIIINKSDESEKYQIHLEKKEFMNKNDERFDLNKFIKENDDIGDLFDNLFEHRINKYIVNGSVGDLNLSEMTIKTLGKLQKVGGNLNLNDCTSLKELGNLESVGRNLYLEGCTSLTSLGYLEKVGGDLVLGDCSTLISLGKLETAAGPIYIENTPLQAMYESGELEERYPKFKEKFVVAWL